MAHRWNRALLALPLLLTVLFLAGCPKRPATPPTAAPAPTGVPSASAPAPAPGGPGAAPGAAATSTAPGATAAPGAGSAPGAAPGTPPRPSEFSPVAALKDIHFDFDRSDIRPGDAQILDANAAWLKSNPNNLVLIEGHCDERGTPEYNLALGERRARAALSYLVSQGVQAGRITVISYGEERPQCTEKTEACWARNRRDRFLVKAR
jgi:peptidoglycan-associated lipoprotein